MFSGSLRNRLRNTSLFSLSFMLIVGAVAIWGLISVSSACKEFLATDAVTAQLAAKIKTSTLELRRFEKDTFLNIADVGTRNDYVTKWRTQHEKLLNQLSEFDRIADSQEEHDHLQEMRHNLDTYSNGYNATLAQIESGAITTPADANHFITQFKDAIHGLEDTAGKEANASSDHLQLAPATLASLVSRTLFGMILIALAAVAVSLWINRKIAATINRDITSIVVVSKKVAQGNVEVEIDTTGDDELAEVKRGYHETLVYMQEMAALSQRIARGDLTVEVHPRSKEDALSMAFLEMVTGLRSLVSSVRDIATQVASGSTQIAQASEASANQSITASSSIDDISSTVAEMSANAQSILRNVQTQASSISETSSSIEQMVANIHRVADHVRKMQGHARESGEETRRGQDVMARAILGLERITESIQQSAQVIEALGSRLTEINRIVEVIDDISEQTNLLALNAAIEAARAGEHGMGFAVVADEVRKLAEKSAVSTREISDMIRGIQRQAEEAVQDMQRSTSIAGEGQQLGGELKVSLGRIEQTVTHLTGFVKEIGTAADEQSTGSKLIAESTTSMNATSLEISSSIEEQANGTRNIVNSMDKMRNLVQQSSSSATELAAASEQMSQLANSLLQSMQQFLVEDGRSTSAPRSLPKYRPTALKSLSMAHEA